MMMLLSRMTRQRRIVDSQKLKQKIFQDHFCSMQKSKQPYPSSYVSFRRKIIDMFFITRTNVHRKVLTSCEILFQV